MSWGKMDDSDGVSQEQGLLTMHPGTPAMLMLRETAQTSQVSVLGLPLSGFLGVCSCGPG